MRRRLEIILRRELHAPGWLASDPTLHADLFAHRAPNYLVLAGWSDQREGLPVLPGSSYLANRAATHCCPGHTVAGWQAKHPEAALVAASSPKGSWTGSRQRRTWRNAGDDRCCLLLLLVILTPAPRLRSSLDHGQVSISCHRSSSQPPFMLPIMKIVSIDLSFTLVAEMVWTSPPRTWWMW